MKKRTFYNLCCYSVRPGQGFWVYSIPGHFNSGIWYFLVKNLGVKYLVLQNFRYHFQVFSTLFQNNFRYLVSHNL